MVIAIGAGIGAAGAIGGAAINSSAAGAASKAQTTASNEALASQNAQWAFNTQQEAPYVNSGIVANTGITQNEANYTPLLQQQYNALAGLGAGQTAQNFLEQTPGYQFTLQQGLQSTQNAAAARGLGVSGAALKGAASYATGLADNTYEQQYGNALQNFNSAQSLFNTLNAPLAAQSQLGENAAVGAGAQGTTQSQTASNTLTSLGNSQAASTIASGNALTSGVNGATNSVTNLLTNPNFASLLGGNGSQYSGPMTVPTAEAPQSAGELAFVQAAGG